MRNLKAVFFGTSAFAVPSLRVVAARTQLAGVVTQPDRPAGRGQRLRSSSVKTAAIELGVRVYQPQRLREFCEELEGQSFDVFVLASYGKILPKALLDLPRLGALNVHPSLLPKYRGATPIQSAIASGERETGVSIMLMDEGLDTGDLILQQRVAISTGETYGEVHDRLAQLGAELLGKALDRAERAELVRHPQLGEATVTRPIRKEELIVDLTLPPQRVVDLVRAFSPQPGARVRLEGELVKILRAHVDANGELEIDELVAPNRGKMSGAEYFRMKQAPRA